jgi:ABC-type dipeptide/oligopeptide/nickel transport system ATPase subunit
VAQLELRNVTKEFPLRRKGLWSGSIFFQAVKQVSFSIRQGECVGIVGESGSGKTTLAKLVMGLERLTSGRILFEGQEIQNGQIPDKQLYKNIQLVLQDSSSSLHPRMNVKEILQEPMRNYFRIHKFLWMRRCIRLLKSVDLDESFLLRYPHQLSGGQKQRVCIARALAAEPKIIIFDESIASLDPVSQSAIIAMLRSLQRKRQLSYLFITHDLESVRGLCDRVVVMYQGEVVETFSSWEYEQLKHPYSQTLFQTLDDVNEGCR